MVGLTLVYGVMEVPNFAHAGVIVLAAYATWEAAERVVPFVPRRAHRAGGRRLGVGGDRAAGLPLGPQQPGGRAVESPSGCC